MTQAAKPESDYFVSIGLMLHYFRAFIGFIDSQMNYGFVFPSLCYQADCKSHIYLHIILIYVSNDAIYKIEISLSDATRGH
jgi:hypothetical protein